MAMIQRALVCLIAFAAVLAAAGPAAAIRLTCDELAAQRSAGRSDEEIVRTYGTTHARLAACDRLAEQAERFAAGRQRFHLARQQRGLSH
jgi:hypothetical protein